MSFNNKQSKSMMVNTLLTTSLLLSSTLADYVHYPVSKNKVVVDRIEKRDTTSDTLEFVIDNEQSYYSVDLIMGSNNQELSVLLDTGSSDLWVLGATSDNVTACEAYLEYAGYLSSSSSSKRDLSFENTVKNRNLPHHISPNCESDLREDIIALAGREDGSDFYTTTLYSTVSGSQTSGSSASSSSSSSSSSADEEEISEVEANCETFGVFTPSDSTTFERNHTDAEFFIEYGDGTFAEGYWGSDQLTINGVAVDGLLFGVANMSNSSNVLGISFPYLESSYQSSSSDSFTYANLPQLLKDTGLIKKVVYSLFLNSLEASSGDLLFGALDTTKYTGSLYTIPLINIYSAYYSDPIEFDITLQGSGYVSSSGKTTTFSTQYLPALLDSGTTLLYLPTTLATIFASAVGAKWDTSLQYFTMSCPSTSTADDAAYVFQFGGINYYVPLANYILETSDASICVLGIQPQSSQYCILGDNTLAALYIVYDLEDYEVAIAQANYAGATDSDIKEITSTIPGATSAPSYSSTWTGTVSTITTGGDIFDGSSASNPWTLTSSIYFESTSIAVSSATGNASTTASGGVSYSTSDSSSGSSNSSSSSGSSSSTTTTEKKNAGTVHVASSVSVFIAFVMSVFF